MSPEHSRELLTFASALSSTCGTCRRPWTDHHVWTFTPEPHPARTATLTFDVECPTAWTEARR